MRKALLGALLLVALLTIYQLYEAFFSKPNFIYAHINQVKVGMSRQEAVHLLSAPDTTYLWEPADTSVRVLHYDMGFGAPDALRVFLRHDTVTAVVYNL